MKALGGSPTPQGIQINDRLTYAYKRYYGHKAKALFARERIFRAAKSNYYKRFLESEKVPNKEKAKTELIVLRNLASSKGSRELRNYVPRVLAFAEENSREASDASFYIPYSFYLEGKYEQGIESFNEYVSQYPTSLLVSKAYYYLARCYQLLGHTDNMWAVCDFCIQEFPGTESAGNCMELLKTISMDEDKPSGITSLGTKKHQFLAELKEKRKANLSALKNLKIPNRAVLSDIPDREILSQQQEIIHNILTQLGVEPTSERGITR